MALPDIENLAGARVIGISNVVSAMVRRVARTALRCGRASIERQLLVEIVPMFDVAVQCAPRVGNRAEQGAARLLVLLGQVCLRAGRRNSAQRYALAALRCNSSEAGIYVLLARNYAIGTPCGVSHDELAGLIPGPIVHLEAALAVAEHGLRIAPADASLAVAHGIVLDASGEFADARKSFRRAIQLDDQNPDAHYRLGRTHAAEAAHRGGFDEAGFKAHSAAMRQTLSLESRHQSARYHLARVSIRAEDWVTVRDAFDVSQSPRCTDTTVDETNELFDAAITDAEVDQIAERVVGSLQGMPSSSDTAPVDWWFAVHWRLLALGRHQAAFAVKRHIALVATAGGGSIDDVGLTAYASRIQAHLFLGHVDEALGLCEHQRAKSRTTNERRVLDWLGSDITLSEGQRPAASRLRAPDVGDVADGRFRQMIEAKTVAVVGPSPESDDHLKEIDTFDTVIRTKVMAPTVDAQSSRVDISYYADTSARLLGPEIRSMLDDGFLKLAVLRPNAWDCGLGQLSGLDDVRFAPSESITSFFSSPYAIQRILFDVLHYQPRSIKLFGANFFLSEQAYHDRYQDDRRFLYANRGLRPNLDGYGHDLLADFTWTKNVCDSGLVSTTSAIQKILDLSPSGYLLRLDERHSHGSAE